MDYKNLPKETCIYRITYTDISNNSKHYIGATYNLRNRIRRHLYDLTNYQHSNKYLQNIFNKYGNVLEIDIIKELPQEIPKEVMLAYETIYHYEFNSIEKGFNSAYPKRVINTFVLTEEQIEKHASKSRKAVIAIDRMTGKKFKEFNSVMEASNFFETSSSNISRTCSGHFNYCKGHVFVYKENFDANKNYIYKNHWAKNTLKSEETKLKMRLNASKNKPVYKYDINYKLIDSYISISQAERKNSFKSGYLKYHLPRETPLNGYIFTHTEY